MGVGETRREQARARAVRRRSHFVWWLLGLITALGILATFVGAWRASRTSDRWVDDLWLEVSKSGVQVVAVGVIGGALAAAWKAISAQREAAATAKEKIRAELAELVVLYNDVKAVRRTLRSLGLDATLHVPGERHDAKQSEGRWQRRRVVRKIRLTEGQVRGFHEQMQVLNRLQLAYEAKVRQFEQADLFEAADRAMVVKKLDGIGRYLNGLVNVWETHDWTIRKGTRLHVLSDPLQKLYRKDSFRSEFSEPMREITQIINKHLFGAPARTDRAPTTGSRNEPSR